MIKAIIETGHWYLLLLVKDQAPNNFKYPFLIKPLALGIDKNPYDIETSPLLRKRALAIVESALSNPFRANIRAKYAINAMDISKKMFIS